MLAIKENIISVRAFAPATCSNVCVGFDILGFAIAGIGDEVTLTKRADHQIVIEAVNESLPLECEKNTASVGIKRLCADLNLSIGFTISIKKGIPLSSGIGGSAASAVAALVAFNAFLTEPLAAETLIKYALMGEEVASGAKHADNIVPCLLGGTTLIYGGQKTLKLPNLNLPCVIVHPHLKIPTKDARALLQPAIALPAYVEQSAYLAAFIAALYEKDLALLKAALVDVFIEPQRAHLIPGFAAIKAKALQAHALGMGISGSGPSLFAFVEQEERALGVANAMCDALLAQGIQADYWLSHINPKGAEVVAEHVYEIC